LGYSLENPHALVLWEGQFGDFFNTAQVIVDQFISSGEDKWKRQCGLVLLLPHGYEGAGPEHSSARLERFLQMSSDNPDHIPDANQSRQIQQSNWQCVNITTPANYYHALRRQLHREFRKPLIVFSPKSLLRADFAKSTIEEFGPGTQFQHVYGDELKLSPAEQKKVKRVIYCSGKVYYDLFKHRASKKINNLALIRLEQLSPFPFHRVAEEALKYPNAEVCWSQEEPMNMGGYTYVKDRFISTYRKLVGQTDFHAPRYIGRPPSASTAEGHKSAHDKTTNTLMNEAVSGL
jgi:2-oxoglutarate dehydrogenase E1 component